MRGLAAIFYEKACSLAAVPPSTSCKQRNASRRNDKRARNLVSDGQRLTQAGPAATRLASQPGRVKCRLSFGRVGAAPRTFSAAIQARRFPPR